MKSLCQSLAKPSEANARALANLFPTTKKQKFDIFSPSANADSARKKKAAFARKGRGRSKSVKVVFLDANARMIPRGAVREKLRQEGRIRDVPFLRYLTFDEVKSLIKKSFSISSEFNFLKSLKDNSLCIAPNQELNGSEVIDLAGHGSLYLESFALSPSAPIPSKYPSDSLPSGPPPACSSGLSPSDSLPSEPPPSNLLPSEPPSSPTPLPAVNLSVHECEREMLIEKVDAVVGLGVSLLCDFSGPSMYNNVLIILDTSVTKRIFY